MASGRSTHVLIVRFRSPPVVNLRNTDAFLRERLNQLNGLHRITPGVLVGVNETVWLRGPVRAPKGVDAGRVRSFDLLAPGRTSSHIFTVLLKPGSLLVPLIHLIDLRGRCTSATKDLKKIRHRLQVILCKILRMLGVTHIQGVGLSRFGDC